MEARPIKNHQDYRIALERIDIIFDAPINTPEGEEAEILALLIEKYEDEYYPI